MSAYVYTLRTSDGTILYVGCTENIGRRLGVHASQPWWPEVSRIESDAYPTRDQGREAEAERIRLLQPVHNIMKMGTYGAVTSLKNLTDAEKAERTRTGATLRTLREIRGWKLGTFANEIGISYAYLSNIEAGRKPLTNQILARSALLLKVEQMAITHPRSESAVAS